MWTSIYRLVLSYTNVRRGPREALWIVDIFTCFQITPIQLSLAVLGEKWLLGILWGPAVWTHQASWQKTAEVKASQWHERMQAAKTRSCGEAASQRKSTAKSSSYEYGRLQAEDFFPCGYLLKAIKKKKKNKKTKKQNTWGLPVAAQWVKNLI